MFEADSHSARERQQYCVGESKIVRREKEDNIGLLDNWLNAFRKDKKAK